MDETGAVLMTEEGIATMTGQVVIIRTIGQTIRLILPGVLILSEAEIMITTFPDVLMTPAGVCHPTLLAVAVSVAVALEAVLAEAASEAVIPVVVSVAVTLVMVEDKLIFS